VGPRAGLNAVEREICPRLPLDRRLGGSRCGRYGEERFTPGCLSVGGWVGPIAGLDAVEREIYSRLPFDRRLGGPQSRSERCEKRDLPPVAIG
jgi:hypothetical protein